MRSAARGPSTFPVHERLAARLLAVRRIPPARASALEAPAVRLSIDQLRHVRTVLPKPINHFLFGPTSRGNRKNFGNDFGVGRGD